MTGDLGPGAMNTEIYIIELIAFVVMMWFEATVIVGRAQCSARLCQSPIRNYRRPWNDFRP